MSFGFSPSDVVKLLEISTRVYIAFKDANENSEAQVESLVREFQNFAHCLLELDELMKDFGRPLPFPVEDFKKTLDKCEASLKPYKEHLVSKKMSLTKFVWTIKYIGKENELESLRKQITGQYQALTLCLHCMHMRLNLESSRREQRLMVEPRLRALSLGGPSCTSGASSALPRTKPLALPSLEDSHPLYKDWEVLSRWLRSEHNHVDDELELVPQSAWGKTSAAAESLDPETASALYRLRCEVEDAIVVRENRAKRAAAEQRAHLAPSDATKRQVRESLRTYTIDSENSTAFNRFEIHANSTNPAATIRLGPSTPSPKVSPSTSPQIEQEFFGSSEWVHSPTFFSKPSDPARSSVSTNRSSISITSEGRLSFPNGLGISTTDPASQNTLSQTLRSVISSASLASNAPRDVALKWTPLCRKVQVERKSSRRVGGKEQILFESHECDIQWKYREDGGMSLRAVFKSKDDGRARLWTIQDFPSLGPSIPLTTTIDGEISIDFPRGSFGKLDKQWIDIKYSFSSSEASAALQTLLYTNNGRDPAELLFDRPIRTISSDKNRPECRGRNLRLWRRTEMRLEANGPVSMDVLVLLFYTSFLEEKSHWVEEPHYVFERLAESVYNKSSDKLTLTFSKDQSKWTPDKRFQRRRSSQAPVDNNAPISPITAERKDSMEIPGITRTGTGGSAASSMISMTSARTFFGRRKSPSRMSDFSLGYAKLDIEFQSSKDRSAFLEVWQKFVKPLRTSS